MPGHRFLRPSARTGMAVCLLLAIAARLPAEVGGIAPKFLVDPAAATAPAQITANDAQTTATCGKDGITVAIAPGEAGYPGITVKPDGQGPWDLSPWGHVEARITNTGTDKIIIGMRVDNAGDWKASPWDAENVTLKPGETRLVKVVFGYAYDFKPAFRLNAGAVTQILFLCVGKSDKARSFRIEDFTASGSAGETPPVDPSLVRAKPEHGIIYDPSMKFDAARQIATKEAPTVQAGADGIAIAYPASKGVGEVQIKPAAGSWDLTDALQIVLKIRNAGANPSRPSFRLDSKNGSGPEIYGEEIAPGADATITLPFAATTTPVVPTDPRQLVYGPGAWNEQNWGPQADTGTNFASGWANGVTVLFRDLVDNHLLITSVVASVPTPSVPDWLGKKPPVDGDWKQTLDENFDGPDIDLRTWNIYGPNVWDKRTHFSKDDATIRDGKLFIHYEKKTGPHNDSPVDWTSSVGTTDYADGYLDSMGKWSQRYGYFEARMKLPKAPGLWPAFWTMPDRGPDAGLWWTRNATDKGGMEFDILEYLSGWGPFRYNLACHWDGYGKEHKSCGTSYNYVQPDQDGFITAGMYWIPGFVAYYAQGQEILHWRSDRVASVPAFIMFSMVSGGWENEPLDDAKLPDDFVIDYVRVWQRKDLAEPGDGAHPNAGTPSAWQGLIEETRKPQETKKPEGK